MIVCLVFLLAVPPDLDAHLDTIKSVGQEGAGNVEAAAAWKAVVAAGPKALLPVLESFDGAGPRASNWLRTAVDAIAERALANKKSIKPKKLERFILDTDQAGPARGLAYGWLKRVDPTAPDRLLPGMLDDPGRELRREAVARAMRETEKPDALKTILRSARERDQVDELAKRLKKLGVKVDLQAHYGVINRWSLITTFNNVEMKGFDVSYGPEKGVDLSRTYEGKGGKPSRVVDHTTDDPRGIVDLNKALGKEKGAIAYAYAVVDSPVARPAEIRVGCINGIKIFLNGKQAFFHHEYHHGMRMDQYVAHGQLKKGPNEVLLKICQNEQTQDWAQKWRFQARICDRLGGAVPFKIVTPAK